MDTENAFDIVISACAYYVDKERTEREVSEVRKQRAKGKGGVVLVNRLWTVFLGLYKIEKEPRKTCGGTSNGKSFQ